MLILIVMVMIKNIKRDPHIVIVIVKKKIRRYLGSIKKLFLVLM